ncbi:hypothetical protein PR202_gb26138 [Eleusine coracana subsp. coracana]|uniref:[RNA-polymerase]-subunit kinase n=1 Tax=Eleusine coracana subsp. coracana TaxID=191504 RepID=A0AAV5FR35_ELECO|nr:hypothetical protein PR202_gb26138 [Eleusine coracana subsp. coracana]
MPNYSGALLNKRSDEPNATLKLQCSIAYRNRALNLLAGDALMFSKNNPNPLHPAYGKRLAPDAAGENKKRVRLTFGSTDDYETLEVVDEGSHGVVFKARHRGTGETVAIKRAKLKHGTPASASAGVLREAACLAACRGHPSILEIRDVVVDPATGALVLVTEFVAGPSLRRVLGPGRRFAEPEARAVMRHLLRGAARMHAAGIVHREARHQAGEHPPLGPRPR